MLVCSLMSCALIRPCYTFPIKQAYLLSNVDESDKAISVLQLQTKAFNVHRTRDNRTSSFLPGALECLFDFCTISDRDPKGALLRVILYAYLRDLDESTKHQPQFKMKKRRGRRTGILRPMAKPRYS